MPLRRPLLTLLVLASFLGACAQAEPKPAGPAPTGSPGAPPPSVTPAPSRTPTPIASCGDNPGQVLRAQTEMPGDERPLSYQFYLPPCFDADRESAYPTLYLMHGLAQSESEWVDLGIAEEADALIAQGSIPPLVIVMPGERTGFDMMAAVTKVLLPEIERSFPTGGNPALRAIGGVSRGAGWALRIGMQRPDLFGAIGLHSPAIISPDLYMLPTWAADVPAGSMPRVWMDIGTEDTLLPAALELREGLDKLRWPYTWSAGRGEHTPDYWSSHLKRYLRWYAEPWPAQVPTFLSLHA